MTGTTPMPGGEVHGDRSGAGAATRSGTSAGQEAIALVPVRWMIVLYDAGCAPCSLAKRFLEGRRQLVPLRFVPAGSDLARAWYPELDHAATMRDLTVVTDGGLVYSGDGAWFACAWALARYRGWADRMSAPDRMPLARKLIAKASGLRPVERSGGFGPWRDDGYGEGDAEEDDAACADGRCGRPGDDTW